MLLSFFANTSAATVILGPQLIPYIHSESSVRYDSITLGTPVCPTAVSLPAAMKPPLGS